jgi:hypothetical protein
MSSPDSIGNAVIALVKTRTAKLLIVLFALIELANLALLPAAKQSLVVALTEAKAKAAVETAKVADERQLGEAEFAAQEAKVLQEKAVQQERLSKALARKTAAEAEQADIAAMVSKATMEDKAILARIEVFLKCTTDIDIAYMNKHGMGNMACSVFDPNYKACKYRWYRTNCLH